MPRPRRLIVPGVPLHITQRGIDRGPTFLSAEDHAYYLWAVRDAAAGCVVHAYVLMPNHVHLLLTPSTPDSPALLMKSVGRRYVRYFNDRYRRTGGLWEGRYRSTPVADAPYFFFCSRYIELNPVRAGIVRDPADYLWSSFAHNALGRHDPTITTHPVYQSLGSNPIRRRAAYLELFASRLEPTELARLRADVRGRPNPDAETYRQAVELSRRWRGEPSRDDLALGAPIRTAPGADERYVDVTPG